MTTVRGKSVSLTATNSAEPNDNLYPDNLKDTDYVVQNAPSPSSSSSKQKNVRAKRGKNDTQSEERRSEGEESERGTGTESDEKTKKTGRGKVKVQYETIKKQRAVTFSRGKDNILKKVRLINVPTFFAYH